MGELTTYIDSDEWQSLFTNEEKGHVLSFCYNLLKWLDRDKADMLTVTSDALVWSRQGVNLGSFPITMPEPTPDFQQTLLRIIELDQVVQRYFINISDDKLVFEYRTEK